MRRRAHLTLRAALVAAASLAFLTCASAAFAADWTEIPVPQPYTHASEEHAIVVVTKDSQGGVWAAANDGAVLVLRQGAKKWDDVSAGLPRGSADSDIQGVEDILAYDGKVCINTSAGVFVRGVDDGPWRKVSEPWEPQVFYLWSFDGAAWSTGAAGVMRLDPTTDKWQEVSQGLPFYAGGQFSSGAAQGDLATTDDYLYFGLTTTKRDDPTFAHAGVYRLRKGTQAWEDTGLRITPTAAEKKYLRSKEYATSADYGPDLLWSSKGYVLCDVGGLSDDSFARFYVYDESQGTWREVPSPDGKTGSEAILSHLASVYVTEPADGKFYFVGYGSADEGRVEAAVYDPASDSWNTSGSVPVVGWPAGGWSGWDGSWHWVYSKGRMVVGDPQGSYVSAPAPTQPTGFVDSVPLPTQVSKDPAVIGTNLILAFVFAIGFGFTSMLFNRTLRENHTALEAAFAPVGAAAGRLVAPIRDRVPGLGRKASEAGGAAGTNAPAAPPASSRLRRILEPIVLVVVAAFIYGFLDPDFGLSSAGLVLLVSLILSIGVVTYAYEGVQSIYCSRRLRIPAGLRFYPVALLVAVICVIVSRVADFSPGYVYGFVGSIAFIGALRPAEPVRGRMVFTGGLVLLAVSVGAWFLAVPVTHAVESQGGWLLQILEGAVVGVFVMGLEGLFFDLIPLSFLDGESLWAWNKWLWLATFSGIAFMFWHVLLNKDSEYVATFGGRNVRMMIGLLIVYVAVTLGTYLYFHTRRRRLAQSAAAAGGGPPAAAAPPMPTPAAPAAPPQPTAYAPPQPTAYAPPPETAPAAVPDAPPVETPLAAPVTPAPEEAPSVPAAEARDREAEPATVPATPLTAAEPSTPTETAPPGATAPPEATAAPPETTPPPAETAPPASAPVEPQTETTRVRRAGYCSVCRTDVWVTAEGWCAAGHATQFVSNVREVPAAPVATAAATTPAAAPAPVARTEPAEPVTPAGPVAQRPGPAPARRLAGFCWVCQRNVWVTPEGWCPAGHDPRCIANVYWV